MPANKLPADEIARTIRDEITQRIMQKRGSLPALSDQDSFDDLGLTSLDVVELIATLEDRAAASPRHMASFADLRTVGDLVRAFASTFPAGRGAVSTEDQALQASRRRAEARRRV
jgi:acyl carrier protein